MTRPLFVLLVVLTLIDLAFVQSTEIVAGIQLLPLWLLAALAPWLRHLQRFTLYRAGWNGGVVLVFALLVHHATTTGLLHMLEDGLVLAVLCQVHLLNNVGSRQRPDLIFFNSFLIAFVTSFFTADLLWSGLFVAHALALVPSLQMHAAGRIGDTTPPVELVRTAWRDGLPRALAVLGVTAIAFVLVPRDFRRAGWLDQAFGLGSPLDTGLAERIRIDDEHATTLPENLVARIVPVSGEAADVPAHWRTTAFSIFEGNAWSPQDVRRLGSRFATDPAWARHADGSLRRTLPGRPAGRVVLHLLDSDIGRLPVPLTASAITLPNGDDLPVNPRSDATLRLLDGASPAGRLECTIDLATATGPVKVAASTREHMLALPGDLPEVVRDLAGHLARETQHPDDALAVAAASCAWLQANRRYQLPGQPGFAKNLGEFLLGSGGGHCEYFATALALCLRVQHVPCRLVGGYLATEWDPASRAIVLRGKHAHAWVEVLSETGVWHTFDATPAADLGAAATPTDGWFVELRSLLANAWSTITGFDGETRARWLAALLALPERHPFAITGLLTALVALAGLRRRRRQVLPSILTLQRAVRAAGLQLQRGETPRELLRRAARAGLDEPRLVRLQLAAQQHEADRYHAAGKGRHR